MSKKPKYGIVVFPGSNCDIDCWRALDQVLDADVTYLWHQDATFAQELDVIILPGGFSYGDYLRGGAIATFSPIMEAVKKHAKQGKLIMGICNGFQMLTEMGLLPGTLLKNKNLKFICDTVELVLQQTTSPFTNQYQEDQTISIPIAHGQGNYYVDDNTLHKMEANGQILFKYARNPNGSLSDIAGICNEQRTILGMMPHPERAVEEIIGGTDGALLFQSIANYMLNQN